ncbi:Carboxylesterase [Limtongia smithiae]|uniref:Carboxylesterase n=1 Tax=Limtongia smithiae TaxID=1125753 RepID=UPI0034CD10B7
MASYISLLLTIFAWLTTALTSPLRSTNGTLTALDLSVTDSSLPIVDLGYVRHRAAFFDQQNNYLMFKNIRYAAPPVDGLRFRPPQAPEYQTEIDDGRNGKVCHQATNVQFKWLELSSPFIEESEDCLFLDVATPYVSLPASNWTAAPDGNTTATSHSTVSGTSNPDGEFLPVMVWIHGGGFVFGMKDGIYNPKGLLDRAQGNMVYVALNYRLGAFGFLGGSEMKKRGYTNLGLMDQRMALDWVKENIHHFGGDSSRVTVLGESAGASSILHHMTSPEPLQFSQAILQSPAFYPQYDNDLLDTQYRNFARLGIVNSFECLTTVDVQTLAKANKEAVFAAPYGTFEFGPYVDRTYVPLLPMFMLGYQRYNPSVRVMAAYNSDEGFIFADPTARSEQDFDALLGHHFPNATADTPAEIKRLYPAEHYSSAFRRVAAVISEWVVSCNLRFLNASYAKSFFYRFSVPPGIHSVDLIYTFWGGTQSILGKLAEKEFPRMKLSSVADRAKQFQEYLVGFAITGDPNACSSSGVVFPRADDAASDGDIAILEVELGGFRRTTLAEEGPTESRCAFWMEGDWTGR